jgi:hypothetical protein
MDNIKGVTPFPLYTCNSLHLFKKSPVGVVLAREFTIGRCAMRFVLTFASLRLKLLSQLTTYFHTRQRAYDITSIRSNLSEIALKANLTS